LKVGSVNGIPIVTPPAPGLLHEKLALFSSCVIDGVETVLGELIEVVSVPSVGALGVVPPPKYPLED
jgi:hypothetical protein